jgi:uncharacterized SAM-binding protein YcdF (DUF218 family)
MRSPAVKRRAGCRRPWSAIGVTIDRSEVGLVELRFVHKAPAADPAIGAVRPPQTGLARLVRTATLVGLAVGAVVLTGFIRFALPPAAENDAVKTDAIVVLTGGSLRLRSGIDLMRQGKGRTLFVSGVNQRVNLEQLLRSAGQESAQWLVCCIVLGHDARNTAGNAQETAQWMRRQGFHSLRLVTAWYHMPRSVLEFHRAMPDLEIIPHPVFFEEATAPNWSGWRGAIPLLFAEYGKYLAALLVPVLDRPAVAGQQQIGAAAR